MLNPIQKQSQIFYRYCSMLFQFVKKIAGILAVWSLLVFFLAPFVSAQDFEEGLERYENGQFREAAAIFEQLEGNEANLFAGKSYFSLGQYLKAKTHLSRISTGEAERDLRLDANYTSALADFQLKQFAGALNTLFEIKESMPRTQIVYDASRLYNGILDYLTLAQRRQAFQAAVHPRIKHDIVRSAFGKVDYPTAKILLEEYKRTLTARSDSALFEELNKMIQDSLSYAYQMAFGNPLDAPRGTVYNIGAALPAYDNSASEFSVSQGLYFGYLLAAEEFNQRNTDKKAFIRYKNTGAEMDSAAYAMTDFAWNYNIDVLLGPLFSEPARTMADLAEQYRIPLLAPLANSDSLNFDNPYVYQANPTFASHGRKMANFAVRELQMDTLGILAERRSLGAASASAFRDEAERLGAHIEHYFVEDLQSQGYDITEYTKFFTTDSVLIDSLDYTHLDGVYAPFTGQVAPTLIDLMLIDLEAMDSEMTILGSPEWGATEIPEERIRDRTIYFSESYFINSKSIRVEQFRTNFSERFGIEASRYAMIGYDTADFLLRTLEQVENPEMLKEVLKTRPLYEGLISNIHFNGTHVNQEVKIFKISDQGVQPATY